MGEGGAVFPGGAGLGPYRVQVGRQIFDDLLGCLDDALRFLGRQDGSLKVLFGVGQRGDEDGIIHVDEGLRLQGRLHDGCGLVLVPCYEALVVRVQAFHGLITQHHPQEGQGRHIGAQHTQADGQGVDKRSPTGPHSQVQKSTATSSATWEIPVLWP